MSHISDAWNLSTAGHNLSPRSNQDVDPRTLRWARRFRSLRYDGKELVKVVLAGLGIIAGIVALVGVFSVIGALLVLFAWNVGVDGIANATGNPESISNIKFIEAWAISILVSVIGRIFRGSSSATAEVKK